MKAHKGKGISDHANLFFILIYSRRDADFGLGLFEDLFASGYSPWIQVPDTKEAHLHRYRVGDPMPDRMRNPIPVGWRFAAVVSHHSVDSWWVKRLAGLPALPTGVEPEHRAVFLLTQDIIMPDYLKGRTVVDFRRRRLYGEAFKEVVNWVEKTAAKNWTWREGDKLLKRLDFADVWRYQRDRHTN